MSVGALYIIPPILYIFTQNFMHLKALFGLAGTVIISETIKYFFIGKSNPRPEGATNCNFMCNDGNQSGKPGMPSSHSAQVAFFYGFYAQQASNSIIKASLGIYAIMVMISRYIKRCHTLSQIAVGSALGLCMSWLAVRQ